MRKSNYICRMENNKQVPTKLLLRIATDLEQEIIRHDIEDVKQDLQIQVNGLKELYKELEDFRTIKKILSKD